MALVGWLLVAAAPGRAQDADPLSQAHLLHQQLLAKPASERTAADYQQIVVVLATAWRDPKDPSADSARFEAARVYVAWARDLSDSQAYTLAARTLLDLLHASPYTAYRRNAEFALAQIQIFHLHEPRAAAVWLRDFDQRYPADPRAAVAHAEARGQHGAEPAYFETSEPLPALPVSAPPVLSPAGSAPAVTPPASAPLLSPPAAAVARQRQFEVRIGNIRGVQVFTNADSTSVVLELRRAVSFHRVAVSERHLVYFDVSAVGAPAAGRAGSANFAIQDGRVARLRISGGASGPTRVEIETLSSRERADQGHYFPNPARLVIAVTGQAVSQMASAPAPFVAARPAQPLPNGAASLTRALDLKIGRIVLDAGHGGPDTGTIAPDGLEEKNVVLDVTLRLGQRLRQRLGVQVSYTRSNDTFIPLEERTAIANRDHADLFVSIHANSSPDAAAGGIETYYLDLTNNAQALAVAARENAGSQESIHNLDGLVRQIALRDKMVESRALAGYLQRSLAQASGEENRGVKSAPFVVLIGAQMPSVLAEISFLSNRADDRKLRQSGYRQRLAEGLYQGLARYIQSLSGVRSAALGEAPGSQ